MHSNPYLQALRAIWIVAFVVSGIAYVVGLGQISGSYLTSGTGNGTFLFANVVACFGFVLFLAWIVVAASRWTPVEPSADTVLDSPAEDAAFAADPGATPGVASVPPQGLEP